MKFSPNNVCPCGSTKKYKKCCKPFHDKIFSPKTALELMKSRFCAFAVLNAEYIIFTSHENNPDFTNDLKLSASLISDTESGSLVAGSSLKYLYNDYITATVYFNSYKDCNNSDSPILSENSDGNEYKLELKADF